MVAPQNPSVAAGAVDAVQVMVNLFDQGAAGTLLPLCQRHDVGVIARSPLYYGALADCGALDHFAPADWRRTYFHETYRQETEARVAQLRCEVGARLRGCQRGDGDHAARL